MKEKSFKRWLSVALAVLMIITDVPLEGGTFEAKAAGGGDNPYPEISFTE